MVLACKSEDGRFIKWPPVPRDVRAFEGVGLFPLEALRARTQQCAAKDRAKMVVAEDIEIPPLIREAHPMLSCTDYRRYRQDPLFLYKCMRVCEHCYLVYAQVATAKHNANTFTAESSFLISAQAQAHRQQHIRSRACIRSHRQAAREATNKRERERSKAKAKVDPKPNAKSQKKLPPVPKLPPRIDESNVPKMHVSCPVREKEDEGAGEMELKAKEDALAEGLLQALSERENALFRDLYNNPNLDAGHPLRHMIEGSKLLGPFAGHRRKKNEGVGLKPLKSNPKLDPNYEHSPYASSQVGKKAGKQKEKKRMREGARQSAGKHREFLVRSMEQVKAEMEDHDDFDEAMRLTEVADIATERLEDGKDFEPVWEQREDVLADEVEKERRHIAKAGIRVSGHLYMASTDVVGKSFMVSLYCPQNAVTYAVEEVSIATVADNFPTVTDPAELAVRLMRRLRKKDAKGTLQFSLELDR